MTLSDLLREIRELILQTPEAADMELMRHDGEGPYEKGTIMILNPGDPTYRKVLL